MPRHNTQTPQTQQKKQNTTANQFEFYELPAEIRTIIFKFKREKVIEEWKQRKKEHQQNTAYLKVIEELKNYVVNKMLQTARRRSIHTPQQNHIYWVNMEKNTTNYNFELNYFIEKEENRSITHTAILFCNLKQYYRMRTEPHKNSLRNFNWLEKQHHLHKIEFSPHYYGEYIEPPQEELNFMFYELEE